MPDTIVKEYAIRELVKNHQDEYKKLYKKYLKDKVRLRALEYKKSSTVMKEILK